MASNYNEQDDRYSGAWTIEEQAYVDALCDHFEDGELDDVANGSTLRRYLSKMIYCREKRITKRFENTDYNGRQQYKHQVINEDRLVVVRKNLKDLREAFLASRHIVLMGRACAAAAKKKKEAKKTNSPARKGLKKAMKKARLDAIADTFKRQTVPTFAPAPAAAAPSFSNSESLLEESLAPSLGHFGRGVSTSITGTTPASPSRSGSLAELQAILQQGRIAQSDVAVPPYATGHRTVASVLQDILRLPLAAGGVPDPGGYGMTSTPSAGTSGAVAAAAAAAAACLHASTGEYAVTSALLRNLPQGSTPRSITAGYSGWLSQPIDLAHVLHRNHTSTAALTSSASTTVLLQNALLEMLATRGNVARRW